MCVGGVLERAEDVFFVTRAELEQPTADLRDGVQRRRDEWRRQRRLVAPLELGHAPAVLKRLLSGAAPVNRRTDLADDGLVGQGASPGRATGRVRLVHGVESFEAFQDGDVLAAHASLVAREFGIPAVVGMGDATRRLRTGQLVTVDGNFGTVRILGG